MRMHTGEQKNTFLGLFAVAIWSFAALLAVKLTSIPPFELLFYEFVIAFFVVFVRYSIAKEKESFFDFKKRDLLIASTALILNQAFYYSAFHYSPAVQVDLINYLWPTMLILFSSLFPNEKFSFSYLIACTVCLLGIYNLLSPDFSQGFSFENITGYFLAFGAAVSWTLYSLYTRYYRSSNSANCISWACGPAAALSLIIHLQYEKFIIPNLFEISLILLLGVFQIGLAFYFWEKALQKGCVKFLGLASYSIPVLSVMILVIFGIADFEQRMITATIAISASPLIPILTSRLKFLRSSSINRARRSPHLAVLENTI